MKAVELQALQDGGAKVKRKPSPKGSLFDEKKKPSNNPPSDRVAEAIKELATALHESKHDHGKAVDSMVAAIQAIPSDKRVIRLKVKRVNWRPKGSKDPIPLIDTIDLIYEG